MNFYSTLYFLFCMRFCKEEISTFQARDLGCIFGEISTTHSKGNPNGMHLERQYTWAAKEI